MEHGHEHQEGKGRDSQEEDDLLHQEPCRAGRCKGQTSGSVAPSPSCHSQDPKG